MALLLSMIIHAHSAELVQLYAAGSLREPLDEAAKTFESATGVKVETKYGPSGLLKDAIAGGADADVFAPPTSSIRVPWHRPARAVLWCCLRAIACAR